MENVYFMRIKDYNSLYYRQCKIKWDGEVREVREVREVNPLVYFLYMNINFD